MAVFISVTTSPFEDVFNARSAETGVRQNVRRPLRGIEVKNDTYATIKVFDALNRPIPFVDSSAPPATGTTSEDGTVSEAGSGTIGQSLEYSNFILQSVQEQRMEKSQIVETFGEDYIFFFGERPRIYTFSAILINSRNFNWKSEWWKNYEDLLRGTKLLERNARMYIYYDDVVIEGYMLQAQAVQATDDPYKLPLTFQVFCTNYSIIGDIGSIFTPLANAALRSTATGTVTPTSAAPDDQEVVAAQAQKTGADSGSLTGFLAQAAASYGSASFQVERALEQVRNTLYGRSLTFPNKGIGNQIYVAPITNEASFPTAQGSDGDRVPIFKQRDEYTAYLTEEAEPHFDENELTRVRDLIRLRKPDELDRQATAELRKLGVNVGRPSAEVLLLGRAAFAGIQTFGSFGIRQADGVLDLALVTGLV